MAKIFVFAGRTHHVERLRQIVSLLSLKGHSVTYLTADNYLNIDPNDAHLHRAGLTYLHALNFRRKHAPDRQQTQMLLKDFGDVADYVDPFHLAASTREAVETLNAFDACLLDEQPQLVLGLHENNFWYRMLAYLCRERNIPAVSFQEGTLRMRDEQTQGKQSIAADYSRLLFCWSESAKQAYIQAGVPEEKLFVSGIAHLDPYFSPYQPEAVVYNLGLDPRLPVVAFLLPQTSRYEGDWQRHLEMVVNWAVGLRAQLIIKPHPFESEIVPALSKQYANYKGVRALSLPSPDIIRAANFVISQHSTVAAETIALGKVFVELDLDNLGVLESLAEQGAAVSIRGGELDNLTKVLHGELKPDPIRVKQWAALNLGPLDGKASERIVARLEQML